MLVMYSNKGQRYVGRPRSKRQNQLSYLLDIGVACRHPVFGLEDEERKTNWRRKRKWGLDN